MIPLIQNDYETPLVFHTKVKDRIIPLVGSKVVFDFISKATGQKVGGGECKILDEASGMAQYTFKEGELAQLGEYQGKTTIDLTQGARRDGIALNFKVIVSTPKA